MLTLRMLVMALITLLLGCDSAAMSVPGWSGLKVLRTRIGIPLFKMGCTVLGCSTFAP
jgi:hypothetical protein